MNASRLSCQVCGNDLDRDLAVACRACGSAYDAECWSFMGTCGVEGCGGTRSVLLSQLPDDFRPRTGAITRGTKKVEVPDSASMEEDLVPIRHLQGSLSRTVKAGALTGLVSVGALGSLAWLLAVPTISVIPILMGTGLGVGLLAPFLASSLSKRSKKTTGLAALGTLLLFELPRGSMFLGVLGVVGVTILGFALAENLAEEGGDRSRWPARLLTAFGVVMGMNLVHALVIHGMASLSLSILLFLLGESMILTAATFPVLELAVRRYKQSVHSEDEPVKLLEEY